MTILQCDQIISVSLDAIESNRIESRTENIKSIFIGSTKSKEFAMLLLQLGFDFYFYIVFCTAIRIKLSNPIENQLSIAYQFMRKRSVCIYEKRTTSPRNIAQL